MVWNLKTTVLSATKNVVRNPTVVRSGGEGDIQGGVPTRPRMTYVDNWLKLNFQDGSVFGLTWVTLPSSDHPRSTGIVMLPSTS